MGLYRVDPTGSLQCLYCEERLHFEAVCWFGLDRDGSINDGGVLARRVSNELVCLRCDERWPIDPRWMEDINAQLEDIGIEMQCLDYGRIADGPTV